MNTAHAAGAIKVILAFVLFLIFGTGCFGIALNGQKNDFFQKSEKK